MAEKRAPRRYVRAVLVTTHGVVNGDAVDARLIGVAREADNGKARFTVNELRAQRGLASI
jgi:hypothetical protein